MAHAMDLINWGALVPNWFVMCYTVSCRFDSKYVLLYAVSSTVFFRQVRKYHFKSLLLVPNNRIITTMEKRAPKTKSHLGNDIIMYYISFIADTP
jgi:hypothetical protein